MGTDPGTVLGIPCNRAVADGEITDFHIRILFQVDAPYCRSGFYLRQADNLVEIFIIPAKQTHGLFDIKLGDDVILPGGHIDCIAQTGGIYSLLQCAERRLLAAGPIRSGSDIAVTVRYIRVDICQFGSDGQMVGRHSAEIVFIRAMVVGIDIEPAHPYVVNTAP